MTDNHDTEIQTESTATRAWTPPPPVNYVTGKTYSGEKMKLLHKVAQEKHYPTHEWATLKQWNRAKKSIAKGEKGVLVQYYELPQVTACDTLMQERRVFLFNRCQTKGFWPS